MFPTALRKMERSDKTTQIQLFITEYDANELATEYGSQGTGWAEKQTISSSSRKQGEEEEKESKEKNQRLFIQVKEPDGEEGTGRNGFLAGWDK